MKGSASPVVPLIVGAVMLVISVYITGQLIENADTAVEGSVKGIIFAIILWFVTICALALGIYRITPRRRYLASTTAAQRASDRADDRAAARLKRYGGVPPKGAAPDYGTRIDPEAPEHSVDR